MNFEVKKMERKKREVLDSYKREVSKRREGVNGKVGGLFLKRGVWEFFIFTEVGYRVRRGEGYGWMDASVMVVERVREEYVSVCLGL